MDVKSPEARSKNMSAIKNRNTKPEVMLRKALFCAGLRYRVKSNLPGKPDIIFPGKRVAVFVDGCFWHGCPECYKEPENNKKFWQNKLIANKKRDEEVNIILSQLGWRVLRFWEHDVKKSVECIVKEVKESLFFPSRNE